jgi:hypothetical protein
VVLHVEELFYVPPGHETVQDEIALDVVISNRSGSLSKVGRIRRSLNG